MKTIQKIWHYTSTKVAVLVLSVCCKLMFGLPLKFKAKEFEEVERR